MNRLLESLPLDAFSRADESDDAVFYARDRFVSHLDSRALATIENLIGQLLAGAEPVILDLMASWDSHIPASISPSEVVGLGLNERELARNRALDEYVLHDLNAVPDLPFADQTFDAVLCTVSIDYMVHPLAVFRDVARILKPGGLFLVTFSNRYFQAKVVKIWRHLPENERIGFVKRLFDESEQYEKPQFFVSRGLPRPRDDKYAPLGIPSDPVYAVYAGKKGARRTVRTVAGTQPNGTPYDVEEVALRKAGVRTTLQCPYCADRLKRLEVPVTPFTEWPSEFVYVCMNDECAYFLLGWAKMTEQGGSGSYRFMYEPTIGNCYAVPVFSKEDLKADVIETD